MWVAKRARFSGQWINRWQYKTAMCSQKIIFVQFLFITS